MLNLRMLRKLSLALLAPGVFVGCAVSAPDDTVPTIETVAQKPSPVTTEPWSHATVSVTDLDRSAAFFRTLGKYETVSEGRLSAEELEVLGLADGASAEDMWLRAPGAEHGLVRLIRFDNAGPKTPTRPGAYAWDTGCFWSIMVRVKDMQSVYDDAIAMGWWTETPITYLEFGPSKLNVTVFKGPDGMQVQGYERLESPLPEGFTPFDRVSQPFNIMQMTRNREAARHLMVDVLGFDTFWYGPPYTDAEPTFMPLGIPKNLTTTIPYKAGIFYPTPSEYGRMEYIEIDGLDGHDFSNLCHAPNLGTLAVAYPVEDPDLASAQIRSRGWTIESGPYTINRKPFGRIRGFTIKTPDGATVEFYKKLDD
jgi:catechol 2,3-dioxygenase-like lactoylglutathione lyase family enzyme